MKMGVKALVIYIISVLLQFKTVSSSFFSTNCPSSYTCHYVSGIFTIKCAAPCSATTGGLVLALPDKSTTPELSFTLSIIAKNNLLMNLPNNLCQYGNDLRILDLSTNAISNSLTANYFSCLSVIETINLSNNFIQTIDENAFDSLDNLISLDLSFNRISVIPPNLFVLKTPALQSLKLQNNLLTEIDVWFFFMQSIRFINLSNNHILKFRSRIGWTPRNTTTLQTLLGSQSTIDMRFNNLTKFDDDILFEYKLCSSSDLSYFLKLMYTVIMTNNAFVCSCDSYNMLLLYQTLIGENAITTAENLFQTTCTSPNEYVGQSIFSFRNSDECVGISKYPPIVYSDCIVSNIGTGNLNALVNPEQALTDEENKPVDYNLTANQIAGIVVGILGLVLFFLALVYCACPVEILACLFDCCPCLYRICPCKSSAVTNKRYDIFVSYNQKSSNKWIQNELIPFFEEQKPDDRYYLHHASDNPDKNGKFGFYTQQKMEESAIILLVLSDAYLMNEWANPKFRDNLRRLLTKPQKNHEDRVRVLGIQLHDVSDEEMYDHVQSRLQIPRFVSLETDEYFFWKKLEYFLYLNRDHARTKEVMPINTQPTIQTSDESTIMDDRGVVNEQFLLDEYTTSLEQIIYEKQPQESFRDIKYDHLNKKFTIKVGKEDEINASREEKEDQKERKSRRKQHSQDLLTTSSSRSYHHEKNEEQEDNNLEQRILNESVKYYRSINRTPRRKRSSNSESIERTVERSSSRSKRDDQTSILKCADPQNMVIF